MTPTPVQEQQLEVTALTQPPGVRLCGEVDLLTLPMLELALELLVDTADDVVVDLDGLTFIDVQGSRALAGAAVRLRATGRRMRVRGASPQLLRMLGLFGWTDLFEFVSPDGAASSGPAGVVGGAAPSAGCSSARTVTRRRLTRVPRSRSSGTRPNDPDSTQRRARLPGA